MIGDEAFEDNFETPNEDNTSFIHKSQHCNPKHYNITQQNNIDE